MLRREQNPYKIQLTNPSMRYTPFLVAIATFIAVMAVGSAFLAGKYIEIETHYRMVREADGRDPSTLNLTPQQYKEKRAATLRAFVKHCVQLMTTSDRTGRRLWRISQTEPWEGAIASLTYI